MTHEDGSRNSGSVTIGGGEMSVSVLAPEVIKRSASVTAVG